MSLQNLFVAKLPRNVTDADLQHIFDGFEPTSAKVMLDAATGKSKGFGFVLFPSEEAGSKAYRALNRKSTRACGHNFTLVIYPSKHDGKAASESSNALYIRNIPMTVTQECVEQFLRSFGSLTYCAMREDHHGCPVWVVYAEYATVNDAKHALHMLHGNSTYFHGTAPILAKFEDSDDAKRQRRQRREERSNSSRHGGASGGGRGGRSCSNLNSNSISSCSNSSSLGNGVAGGCRSNSNRSRSSSSAASPLSVGRLQKQQQQQQPLQPHNALLRSGAGGRRGNAIASLLADLTGDDAHRTRSSGNHSGGSSDDHGCAAERQWQVEGREGGDGPCDGSAVALGNSNNNNNSSSNNYNNRSTAVSTTSVDGVVHVPCLLDGAATSVRDTVMHGRPLTVHSAQSIGSYSADTAPTVRSDGGSVPTSIMCSPPPYSELLAQQQQQQQHQAPLPPSSLLSSTSSLLVGHAPAHTAGLVSVADAPPPVALSHAAQPPHAFTLVHAPPPNYCCFAVNEHGQPVLVSTVMPPPPPLSSQSQLQMPTAVTSAAASPSLPAFAPSPLPRPLPPTSLPLPPPPPPQPLPLASAPPSAATTTSSLPAAAAPSSSLHHLLTPHNAATSNGDGTLVLLDGQQQFVVSKHAMNLHRQPLSAMVSSTPMLYASPMGVSTTTSMSMYASSNNGSHTANATAAAAAAAAASPASSMCNTAATSLPFAANGSDVFASVRL